jgi:glycosyltransferase involved in cell wall biosynthesis
MTTDLDNVPPDLAVLVSFSGEGGVERMILNLLNAMASQGYRMDLLLIKTHSKHLEELHPQIRRIELGSQHSITSLWPLSRYLKQVRPPCLLAAKDRAGRVAVLARALAGAQQIRLVLRLGTNLTAALAHKPPWQTWLRRWSIRRIYPHLDKIITVSEGVRQDTLSVSGINPDKIEVVRNPVITPQLIQDARAAPPHPWLIDRHVPVILGAGRLTLQKDFSTLIRAFAKVRESCVCRLIILGEGQQREVLQTLALELGVAQDLALPGFTSNPYVYMRHVSLFVLSSRWEGSPNVLTEAMALGVPVVSTNCPSGPSEILEQGRIAPLVPVGDDQVLAQAILTTLKNPPEPEKLQKAVSEYHAQRSATHYLEIIRHTLNP